LNLILVTNQTCVVKLADIRVTQYYSHRISLDPNPLSALRESPAFNIIDEKLTEKHILLL